MTAVNAGTDARLVNIPLDEVPVEAKHGDQRRFELVTSTVSLADAQREPSVTVPLARVDMRSRRLLTTI